MFSKRVNRVIKTVNSFTLSLSQLSKLSLPCIITRAGYRSVFFDKIFVSIQIDRHLIFRMIHALKTVIYELFVKSSQ